jgi:hypothetical protein
MVAPGRAWSNISSDALYRCTGVVMVNKQRLSLSTDAVDSFFQALLGLRVILGIDFLTSDQVIPVNDAYLVPENLERAIYGGRLSLGSLFCGRERVTLLKGLSGETSPLCCVR